jgi:aldehyde:ferredoxin oxidoreductase
MIRDHFRVLVVDLSARKGKIVNHDGRDEVIGGSGLAAFLFDRYGHIDRPWQDPDQPLIFAIGPLTGYFPLMSKTVCAFKSPYHDQYAESHAGGRSALSLKFANLDALVIVGKAPTPVCLAVGAHQLDIQDVHFLWGKNVKSTGKQLRRMFPGSGHRSILRIGPAGEIGAAMAGINVDTYRHFGRLGGGAVMGVKNIKGIVIEGDDMFELPAGREYQKLFQNVYDQLTTTDMMKKYHDLGTPANIAVLNNLKALPCRNLQQTSDPQIRGITGEAFAEETLLRNQACSGCPIGCIHLGYVREKFHKDHRYYFSQVSYDHEPIFATGAMLGVTHGSATLGIIDEIEEMGLDVVSAGVALAWATEATEKGIISDQETIVSLRFGHAEAYKQAVGHLGSGVNDFYRLLGMGTFKAAEHYGGADYACVLGQEMAGYATGEVFYTAQSLGFRHSHLDSSGYSYDQKHDRKDVQKAVDFLITDEQERVLLTSMVACLFARKVYTQAHLVECLNSLSYSTIADNLETIKQQIQRKRWQLRLASGFQPEAVTIPRRFTELTTWKGKTDANYLKALKSTYAQKINAVGAGA